MHGDYPGFVFLRPGEHLPRGPAWRAAEALGIDLSIGEENLRKTPLERLRHAEAVAHSLQLLQSMRRVPADRPKV